MLAVTCYHGLFQNSAQILCDESTVHEVTNAAKLRANALQSAGGYSLRAVVRHCPKASFPMDAAFGKWDVTLPCQTCSTKSGRLSVKIDVGFGDFAPSKPCEISCLTTPGSWQSKIAKGVRQIEAKCSSLGGAGCSRAPHPPTT